MVAHGAEAKSGDTISVIVIMGVAGSGKTTVGAALGAALRWRFVDADDFHSAESVARMRRGTSLTDEDRAPWLAALQAEIVATLSRGERAVVACSALRAVYREALIPQETAAKAVRFVYLDGDEQLLRERLSRRVHHFAGVALLESQLATLEEPADALRIDAGHSPEDIVRSIRGAFGL